MPVSDDRRKEAERCIGIVKRYLRFAGGLTREEMTRGITAAIRDRSKCR